MIRVVQDLTREELDELKYYDGMVFTEEDFSDN